MDSWARAAAAGAPDSDRWAVRYSRHLGRLIVRWWSVIRATRLSGRGRWDAG